MIPTYLNPNYRYSTTLTPNSTLLIKYLHIVIYTLVQYIRSTFTRLPVLELSTCWLSTCIAGDDGSLKTS